jgi:hypothetical protein
MVCLRNISVDTLHKGDTKDNNNNNSNANNDSTDATIKHFLHRTGRQTGRKEHGSRATDVVTQLAHAAQTEVNLKAASTEGAHTTL